MRRILGAFASFLMAVALLLWQYPWSVIHGGSMFPVYSSVLAYAVAAVLMSVVVIGAHLTVARMRQSRGTTATWGWSFLLSIATFVCVALLLGPGGLNVPGTRVRGAFFAEWDFLVFIIWAIPYALAASALLIALGKPNSLREAVIHETRRSFR